MKKTTDNTANLNPLVLASTLMLVLPVLSGCKSESETSIDPGATGSGTIEPENTETLSELDISLQALISDLDLAISPVENRDLPDINDPLPQLGKKLFFSKSLSGQFDTACVSCHHPALGGADGLSLPVGVESVNPELLGPGRVHQSGIPPVPRNSPTVFNVGLWDTGLFFDSRVESIGKEPGTNGAISGIRTPDSIFLTADSQAGANLAAAQARFPVTSVDEMKTSTFENGSDNNTIREHLAARIGDYAVGAGELTSNNWLPEFQQAFATTETAETLITFDNIALAIGEYERSMVFVDSPWQRYLDGDTSALTEQQKQGAVLFFTPSTEGGAGCAACHNGPLLSDGRHHTVAFPQFGPGKGDGDNDDFGRERETGDSDDRYKFRTPSLLNITLTAPYGHTGAYESLRQVIGHYRNANRSVNNFFDRGAWCQLDQFESVANCATLYPDAASNSQLALNKLNAERQAGQSLFVPTAISNEDEDRLIAFLTALTDDCALNRSCLSPWVADSSSNGPDNQQLNATDDQNNPL
ncbi:cytochrome-c peroxidase [Alkalimarinus coralli]|uniref:cytochrome-c peroxidase n=1 Tax=Alkalimarinus coralli TaxID=2935863 RepID=UPI00202AD0F2|nr:cytochrome c peroxidase [Alkalimarinus coralli]